MESDVQLPCGCWMAANNYNNFDGPYLGLSNDEKTFIPDKFSREEFHEKVDYTEGFDHEQKETAFQGKGSRMTDEENPDEELDDLDEVFDFDVTDPEDIWTDEEVIGEDAGFPKVVRNGKGHQEQILNGGRAKGVEPRAETSEYLNVVYMALGICAVILVGMCMAYTKKEEKYDLQKYMLVDNFEPASTYGTAL